MVEMLSGDAGRPVAHGAPDQSHLRDRRDGLERLWTARALDQLAADLEATAIAFESNGE